MSWYVLDALDDAFDETEQLLRPFDASRWLRLAIVVFFLGSLGNGGGSGPEFSVELGQGATVNLPLLDEIPLEASIVEFAPLMIAVVILLALVYLAVSSVMEFVFVDAVMEHDFELLSKFRERTNLGVELFVFRIFLFILVVAPLLAIVVTVFGSSPSTGLGVFFLILPVMVIVGFAVWLVDTLTREFVVPVMIVQETGILDAWRSFWPTVREQWKQFAVYILARVGLGFLAGVVVGVVSTIVFAPLAFATATTLFMPFRQPGAFEPVFLLSLAFGIMYGFLALAIVTFVLIPIHTYLRYLSLLVLGDANETFDLLQDS